MIKDVRKVNQSLLKKGFIKKEGAKHTLYLFFREGKKICETFMSRDEQNINEYLINKMRQQVYLNKRDFIKLIDCPLSEEEYIKILKDKDLL